MPTPPRPRPAYAVPLNDPGYVAQTFKVEPRAIVIGDKGGALIIKDGQITVGDGWGPSAAAVEVVRCINAAFGPTLEWKTVPGGQIVNRNLAGAMNDGFRLAISMCAGLARGVAEAFPIHASAMHALAEGMEACPAPVAEQTPVTE